MKTNKLINYVAFVLITSFCLSSCTSFKDEKGFGINYDRRTPGTIIDDQGLSLRITNILAKDKELWKRCNINTLVFNNSVLLVGQAPTTELKEHAEEIIYKFVNRDKIYNQINIGEPINFLTKVKDSWITTQVKGKIMGNKKIGINRIKVITEDGVIYLMGILTKEEEELAIELASTTPRVKQVIKIIEEHL